MAETQILRGWEIEAKICHLLHSATSSYYKRMNMLFMVPIIMLSSSTGTLGLTSASLNSSTGSFNILGLIIGIFGFISATLNAIHQYLDVQKLHTVHSSHSIEYNKIAREIKLHIYLSESVNKQSLNTEEFILQCKTKIDRLIETAESIPQKIEKKLHDEIQTIRDNELAEFNELFEIRKNSSLSENDKPDIEELKNDITLNIEDDASDRDSSDRDSLEKRKSSLDIRLERRNNRSTMLDKSNYVT